MIKILLILVSIFAISSASSINIDTILEKAKKSHKQVLIFLHRPSCGYCEKMVEFTLPDEKIAKKIKNKFIFVDINIGESGDITFDDFRGTKQEFAIFLGYNFYPSVLFIDKDKEISYAAVGYKNEDDFFKILRFVESHSYDSMTIDEFK